MLCVGPIIANTIYYYAGLPLTPLLLGRNPVLLSALRGSIASMVAAGGFARVGRAPLLLALIAPIPISMMTDPFFFWAGKRYGRGLIDYLSESDPRWRKRDVVRRAALALGDRGDVGGRGCLEVDHSGRLGAGWAIGQPAVTVAETISNYALWIIVGMVVLIIAWSMWSAWRTPRETTER